MKPSGGDESAVPQKAQPTAWTGVLLITCVVVLVLSILILIQLAQHPDPRLILDYILALRWPLVVLLGLILLRPKLLETIGRIEELSGAGMAAKLTPIPQQPTQPQVSSSSELDPGGAASPELEATASDTASTEDLAEIDVEPPEGHEENESLEQELGQAKLELEFERIYRVIYGTQIKTLRALSGSPPGLNPEDISPYFAEHERLTVRFPTSMHPNPQSFMSYLVRLGLVDYDPSSRVYKLATKGAAFLAYLSNQRLSEAARIF